MHIPFPPWDMVKIHPWKDIFLQGTVSIKECSPKFSAGIRVRERERGRLRERDRRGEREIERI